MTRDSRSSDLREIPGVGPSTAQALRDLGVHEIADLSGGDPETLYQQLCDVRGTHIDRCVLYVFRCAVYYASRDIHDPELLKWWNWKDIELKTMRVAQYPVTRQRRNHQTKRSIMAELKTKPTKQSVTAFLQSIDDDERKRDCRAVMKIMREATGARPKMWGPSIVGFGNYRYKYPTGREGDWFVTGFSPRKQALTLYIMSGFSRYKPLLKKLGKYKTGKSCLYIKRLSDVDLDVLASLVRESVKRPMGAT